MAELKENLRENFIKPLKFKFLMMELETPPSVPPLQGEGSKIKKEKDLMYKQIHDAYKKFNV